MATKRQVQATKNFMENRGNWYKAMRDAGYSHATAKNPKNVTRSKALNDLLDEYAPIQLVALGLGTLLDAYQIGHYVFPAAMTNEEVQELIESLPSCRLKRIVRCSQSVHAYYWIPDNKSRKGALDMLLKIRGEYSSKKTREEQNPFKNLSNEELDQQIRILEAAQRNCR